MRIVAGEWRGRKLVAPKGDSTRPTADRTRETLFSMLTSRLGTFEGLRAADLFAGSGALGLDALSRGAGHCLFVEQEKPALDAIRTNITTLGAKDRAVVQAGSVTRLGPARQPYDLILLDPPYHTGAGAVALDRLKRLDWISESTWIALETAANEDVDIKQLECEVLRRVGKAAISLWRLNP